MARPVMYLSCRTTALLLGLIGAWAACSSSPSGGGGGSPLAGDGGSGAASGAAPPDAGHTGGGGGSPQGGDGGADGGGGTGGAGGEGGGCVVVETPAEDPVPPVGATPWVFPPDAPYEQRPPWRAGSCTGWSQVPPVYDYPAPAISDEGLWIVSGQYLSSSHVLHLTRCGWTMTGFGPRLSLYNVAAGTDWVATSTSDSTQLPYRRGGTWYNLAHPEPGAGTGRVHNVGGILALTTFGGTIDLYDPLTGWRRILPAGTGNPHALWGDPADLFETYDTGVRRWDGSRWRELSGPAPQRYAAIAGSGTEVFVSATEELYLVSGDSLVQQPAPDCGDGAAVTSYADLAAGGGTLALSVKCRAASSDASTFRVFLRSGGAWVATPALPAPIPLQPPTNDAPALRVDPAGVVYASAADGQIQRLDPTGWTSLVETPAPTWRSFAGRTRDELYAIGDGVARLAADGLTWAPVAGSEAIRGRSACRRRTARSSSSRWTPA